MRYLEHLRIPPLLVVREMLELLTPGGSILLTVPNVGRLGNLRRLWKGLNVVEPLKVVDRTAITDQGISVFDDWIHVREPSVVDMRELVGACGEDMHWRVWLPRDNRLLLGQNFNGLLGQGLELLMPRLRETIYCLGQKTT